jgi:hypothetical protein
VAVEPREIERIRSFVRAVAGRIVVVLERLRVGEE